jgi:hypothetical protein
MQLRECIHRTGIYRSDVGRTVRTFNTGDGLQILVDGFELMVRHVVKRQPGHDLEKIAIHRRGNAVQFAGSGVGVAVVQVGCS